MKIISNNKKAYHDYFILETFEAGIELKVLKSSLFAKAVPTLRTVL